MVSMNSSPPVAMPVQVPPGHVLQQIVDESGTVRHVILPTPHHLPHTGSHHVMHAGNFVPGNMAAQQYYHAGVSQMGFTPVVAPHFHPPMGARGGHFGLGHSLPQNSPPQSPSAAGYSHKDERTQKQYVKLKRKLVQKQMQEGQPEDLTNGLRNDAQLEDESGSAQEQEEEETETLEDILSTIAAPNVAEITARSALLIWSGPITELNEGYPITYDVLLGDTRLGKEGRFKSIYSGTSQSCRIQDLRPGQQYTVCLQGRLNGHVGAPSEPAIFVTSPCEPDAPASPKIISRTRTSLQLRWSAASDNGSHVQHYLLEYDEGSGGVNFVELTKTKGKQTTVTKLLPNKCYRFRLAAINAYGRSDFSDIVAHWTAGFAPAQPKAPEKVAVTSSSLHIKWYRQAQNEEYTLQMEDPTTKHGFLAVYSGPDTELLKNGLRRNTEFKFRLQAHNEDGKSSWSETSVFRTLPDKPGIPGKPFVKGKIHAHSFKVKWDPPMDKGGSTINKYNLELALGEGDFKQIYIGPDTEAICDRLHPGTLYKLRVSCESSGGWSEYSDIGAITTEAVCPGQCEAPVPSMRPEATLIGIRWEKPLYDGGSPITEYDVEMTTPKDEKRIVFHGSQTECKVLELSPGTSYIFTVRAINRVGAGIWSNSLILSSGPAPPDAPSPPEIKICSPTHINITWSEPSCNGSPITGYRLEMSNFDVEDTYSILYSGPNTSYDARNLIPFTKYFVRLIAINNAGSSQYSKTNATFTPASAPSSVCAPTCEVGPNKIFISWKPSSCNGSDITHYNIELGDQLIKTEDNSTSLLVENLLPEMQYRIRVQAVNDIGNGPFSTSLKVFTLPLPPVPPTLEVASVGHNYLKLKWGGGRNTNFTQFHVEMFNQRTREFQSIYQGMSYVCKVNKLQEQTQYSFRISASNDEAGQGDFSEVVSFSTGIAPPSGIKSPKLLDVSLTTCTIEWTPCKQIFDKVVYAVQYSSTKDPDFKEVYKGSNTKYTLDNLEPEVEYHVRVVPIRLIDDGQQLAGPSSPVLIVNTLIRNTDDIENKTVDSSTPVRERRSTSIKGSLRSEHRQLSDQQWAGIIIIALFIFALLAAIITEAYINWHKST